jgi:hypothetical protein
MEISHREPAIARPVVGVLIGKGRIEKLNMQSSDFRTYFWFRELFKANNLAKVTLYTFTTSDVDMDTAQIIGTYFDESSGMWTQRRFPYPDVLYIRGVSTSQQEEFKNLLHHFDQLGVKKINPEYLFNKWDLYNQLKKVRAIRTFLPKSVRIKDVHDLSSFLKKYSKIYIKTYYGSRGKQVIHISKLPQGGYQFSHNRMGDLSIGQEKDVQTLFEVIHTLLGNNRILAQKAIDLIGLNNRNVDFRAEVQRNRSGDLDVVAIAARIGESHSPITTHADVCRFDEFWRNYFNCSNYQVNKLTEKVNNFLILVFESVEQAYGAFGDLGIDFGIDWEGQLWLIECNARSAKVSFMKSADEETIQKGFLNPLEYAKFLYLSKERTDTVDDSTELSGETEKHGAGRRTSKQNHASRMICGAKINLHPRWSDKVQPREYPTINLSNRWSHHITPRYYSTSEFLPR